MPYKPAIHRRRSTRLRQYDYALPGNYVVTICTHKQQHLFGEIRDEGMVLNDAGRAAQAYWHRLMHHFVHIRLDAFVVMPNHIHGIIEIVKLPDVSIADDADGSPPTSVRGEAFGETPTSVRGEALSEQPAGLKQEGSGDNASPLRSPPSQIDRPNGPHRYPSAQLSAITNLFPPGKSTACGVPQVTQSGNAITTIASSATNKS